MRSSNLKTKIYFEGDSLKRLSQLEYKKVFIISDPFIVSSGLINAVTKHLRAANIEFTVYSNRKNKLSTYIKFNIFKVGDAVSIEHSYLAKEGYTQVNNAVKISKCAITVDGDVLIPE